MAHQACAQCGRVEDTRSLSLCPTCQGVFCSRCMPRHRMQCACASPEAVMRLEPL